MRNDAKQTQARHVSRPSRDWHGEGRIGMRGVHRAPPFTTTSGVGTAAVSDRGVHHTRMGAGAGSCLRQVWVFLCLVQAAHVIRSIGVTKADREIDFVDVLGLAQVDAHFARPVATDVLGPLQTAAVAVVVVTPCKVAGLVRILDAVRDGGQVLPSGEGRDALRRTAQQRSPTHTHTLHQKCGALEPAAHAGTCAAIATYHVEQRWLAQGQILRFS